MDGEGRERSERGRERDGEGEFRGKARIGERENRG
jgi:hypothetical protein